MCKCVAFKVATANTPFQSPQVFPSMKVAPDSARVGAPVDQIASTAFGNLNEVGHRYRFVVAGYRVPAEVARYPAD